MILPVLPCVGLLGIPFGNLGDVVLDKLALELLSNTECEFVASE